MEASIEYAVIPPSKFPKSCKIKGLPKRAAFFHTYCVNELMNYFRFYLAKSSTQFEK